DPVRMATKRVMALSGDIRRATGRVRARPTVPPRPGAAPTTMPMTIPTTMMSSEAGWRVAERPSHSRLVTSIGGLRSWQPHVQPVLEQDVQPPAQHQGGDHVDTPRRLSEHPQHDEHEQGRAP